MVLNVSGYAANICQTVYRTETCIYKLVDLGKDISNVLLLFLFPLTMNLKHGELACGKKCEFLHLIQIYVMNI